jgi:hypothetical protein
VVDVKVPKQYIMGRSVRKSTRNEGKILVGINRKGVIAGLDFRGGVRRFRILHTSWIRASLTPSTLALMRRWQYLC